MIQAPGFEVSGAEVPEVVIKIEQLKIKPLQNN
jgi:hypothetical protein